MPEEEIKEIGSCPICDSKVDLKANKCPECKADLTVFGVKTGDDEAHDVNLPEFEESLEALLGEIGKEDNGKEHEIFEEIMAAVDKTNSVPEGGAAVEEGAVQGEVQSEGAVAEEPPSEPVMFECPLCNTLVDENAKACPGCGAIFATGEEEAPPAEEQAPPAEAEQPAPETPVVEEAAPQESVEFTQVTAPAEEIHTAVEAVEEKFEAPKEPVVEAAPPEVPVEEEEEEPSKAKKKFKIRRKKEEESKPKAEPKAPPPPPKKAPPPPGAKDEKALHAELAKAVSEVKPLLTDARQIGVDVSDGRKLIDEAIAAGKKRAFQNAINLVRKSEKTIENAIKQHITDSVGTAEMKIEALEKAGGNVGELKSSLGKVESLLKERKYGKAAALSSDLAKNAEMAVKKMKASLKKMQYMAKEDDVNERLKDLIDLIKSGEEVLVNVKKAKALLTQARVAMKRSEWEKAKDLLTDAKEDFLKELPKQLTAIISNSKPVLYKAKMQGVDIKSSIKLLKEASTALKLNNYLDALEAIKRYNVEMKLYIE